MELKNLLIGEIQHEATNTRKILEKVPVDKFGWQPHGKSMTAGRLASHIAELPIWVNRILEANEFDFAAAVFTPTTYSDTVAIMKVFEERKAAAIAVLEKTTDEYLNEQFIIRRGAQVVYQLPRHIMLRNIALNHMVHHRGQLSVYLRLLDIPVPGIYGPSADEKSA